MQKNSKEVQDIKGPDNNKIISWVAPTSVEYKKGAYWYLVISLVAAGLATFFIWQKQYLSTVVVILAPLVFFLISREKSQSVKYSLSREGLKIDEKNYLFEQLKSFWIVEGPSFATLYLETTKKFSQPLTLYLVRVDHSEVKNFLKAYLPEQEGKNLAVQDQISRFLKL